MTHEKFLERLAPCIERGDLDTCVEEASRLAKEAEIDAKELLVLSAAMGKSNNYKLAYVLALAAMEGLDGVDRAVALLNAGLAAQYIGEKTKAEEKYKMALEIKPEFAKAEHGYAILLMDLGRGSEAEEHYKKALEIEPNLAEVHNNYAILLKDLGRRSEEEEHYKKALKIEPNLAEVHNNYANLLMSLGRKNDAEEHYKKAIEGCRCSLQLRNPARGSRKKD
jgi:Tfp pilus assembly protein PilF